MRGRLEMPVRTAVAGILAVTGGAPAPSPLRWNPADKATTVTLSNSDATATVAPAGTTSVRGTGGKATGKWFYEVLVGGGEYNAIGLGKNTSDINSYPGSDATSASYYSLGLKFGGTSAGSNGASYGSGASIGVAFDGDAQTVTFFKNGVQQGSPTSLQSGTYYPMVGNGGGGSPTVVTLQDTPAYPIGGYQQWTGAA